MDQLKNWRFAWKIATGQSVFQPVTTGHQHIFSTN
jgi:hypothetical protein